ncbi:MAG: transcription initiation factor IIB family protein [Promethearchaeota archaeon]
MNAVYNLNKTINSCPECGGNIISLQETGDVVCNQCGLVMQERNVDFSHSGRRAYSNEEKSKRERTGAPITSLVPDIGLTTTIDKKKIDNPDLKRAAKWDTRISWKKRNILIATTELKRISTNLNLPNHVKEEAMRLYREVFKQNLLRGRSINSMIAACLYYAIRKYRLARTLHEILEETAEKDKDVRRCYRVLIRELNLKAPNTKPSALIPRYIAELGLSSEIENLAIKVVKTYISNFSSSGKDPKGIVGGAIYLACKIKNKSYTQKQIADSIGVTEVTLRSRYKELREKLNISI